MIPKLIHRSVPTETTDQVESWWSTTVALHPDWQCVTWRDPLNPNDFPVTSPHWHRCASGAQLAGLVRLELLWTHGGIWLDSDVELFRRLDPLLCCSAFGAWEDTNVVPDAVLGAEAEHPAVRACMDLAVERINTESDDWRTGRGAWSTGPGVTTTVLPGRTDVLLLPPGAFFDVHYTDKSGLTRPAAPYEFGRHHWHASWL